MSKEKNNVEIYKKLDSQLRFKDCFVSKASREIMLDRFFKGSKLEFPF